MIYSNRDSLKKILWVPLSLFLCVVIFLDDVEIVVWCVEIVVLSMLVDDDDVLLHQSAQFNGHCGHYICPLLLYIHSHSRSYLFTFYIYVFIEQTTVCMNRSIDNTQ